MNWNSTFNKNLANSSNEFMRQFVKFSSIELNTTIVETKGLSYRKPITLSNSHTLILGSNARALTVYNPSRGFVRTVHQLWFCLLHVFPRELHSWGNVAKVPVGENVGPYYFYWRRSVINMVSQINYRNHCWSVFVEVSPEARRQEIIDFFNEWEKRKDFTTFENNQMYWITAQGFLGCF